MILAALLVTLAAPALAQTGDQNNPPLRSLQRGIGAVNSSGQVGSLIVFRGSPNPSISVDLKGTRGQPEAVTINRGKSCHDFAGPRAAVLGTLHAGRLRATSTIPRNELLSGNYNLIVHNNAADSRPVACGHLYIR